MGSPKLRSLLGLTMTYTYHAPVHIKQRKPGRGATRVLLVDSDDVEICEVFGETLAEAVETAERIASAINREQP